jgi:archaellum biogenesis ATPase FlaH
MNHSTQAMMSEFQRQVGDELLEASVFSPTREFSRLQIAQVAKTYQVPVELAEQIASSLIQKQFGVDVDAVDFNNLVKQVAEIENNIPDQGLRLYKLQELARRSKRSYRELMECYNKALLNQKPIETMNLKQLREKTEAETNWLIPGWLPQGTNLLFFGDGGTGKTLMAYQWLAAIANGTPWNGYQVKQGRCLLVQCDEPEIVLRNRMDLLQLPDDAPIDIITDWSTDAIPRLRSYIEEHKPAFILIDSLSAVNKSCCFSENDMEYARPILQLTQLCSEFNLTICLIHHSNAAGQARGTRAIHNSVSEVWALRQGEGQSERVLAVLKTRLGRPPGGYKFLFSEDDHSFQYLGNADDPDGASATQEEKIRLWMYQSDNRAIPYTPVEVAEACSISQPSTRKALHELWAKGLISRRPSKFGRRGYVYSSPKISSADNDPAILAFELGIAPKDRSSNPEHEEVSAICDPAILENHTSEFKNLKKEGSQDRKALKSSEGIELQRIATSDPEGSQDRKNSDFVADSLQKGDEIEILINKDWVKGKFVRLPEKMHYSKRLNCLMEAVEVEFKGNRLITSIDGIRQGGTNADG